MVKRKRIVLLLIFIFFSISRITAYNSKTDFDSINRIFKLYTHDKVSFKVVRKKLYTYYNSSNVKDKGFVKRLIENSKHFEGNPELYCIHSLVVYDLISFDKNYLDILPIIYKSSIKVKKVKNIKLQYFTETNVGSFYLFLKDYQNAKKYYYKALKKANSIKDTNNMQVILYNIAGVYFFQKKVTKSKWYLNKVIELESDTTSNSYCDYQIAKTTLLLNEKKHQEALTILLSIHNKTSKRQEGIFYNNLGLSYMGIKQYSLAEKAFLKSYNFVKKNERRNINNAYKNLSNCYEKLNNTKLLIYYNKKCIEHFESENKTEKLVQLDKLKVKEFFRLKKIQKQLHESKINIEIEKRYSLILILIFSIVLLGILIFIIIINNKKMRLLVNLNIEKMKLSNSELNIKNNARQFPDNIIYSVIDLMDNESIYLDPDLTIQKMANMVKTNVSDLSKSINSYYQMNFRSLVNIKRVEFAKKVLLDKTYDNYSMSGIAETVGYKNMASFYKNFKLLTGVTPANFQSIGRKIIDK